MRSRPSAACRSMDSSDPRLFEHRYVDRVVGGKRRLRVGVYEHSTRFPASAIIAPRLAVNVVLPTPLLVAQTRNFIHYSPFAPPGNQLTRRFFLESASGAGSIGALWACSSVGQSSGLIIHWSKVRVLPGPPSQYRRTFVPFLLFGLRVHYCKGV